MTDVTPAKPLSELLAEGSEKSSELKVEVYKPAAKEGAQQGERPVELGGPKGPEPTRYGDWEKKGRCIDF